MQLQTNSTSPLQCGMIRTKRWNDAIEPFDGTRILVCRYRPRGVARAAETWSEWQPDLGPSKTLHAAAYGKGGIELSWVAYRATYLREMQSQREAIDALARRVASGETITLLCSAQCERESRCHRSLLKELIARAAAPPANV
jgi:uncharacterized protein YeaO (DUF488 family)